MSYTIIQSPNFLSTVNNKIIYVVNSSNKTLCKHKYICNIYGYSDVSNTYSVIGSLKLFPEPLYGYGVFDVSKVLKSYLEDTIHTDSISFIKSQGSVLRYYIQFGEEYDATCQSTASIYNNIIKSEDRYAFNGKFTYQGYINEQPEQEFITIGDTRKFLTNKESETNVALQQKYYLSFVKPVDSEIVLEVKTYDSDNNFIDKYYYEPTFTDLAGSAQEFIQSVGVGPMNLNANLSIPYNLSESIYGAISSDVSYYTVQLQYKNDDNLNLFITNDKRIGLGYEITTANNQPRITVTDQTDYVYTDFQEIKSLLKLINNKMYDITITASYTSADSLGPLEAYFYFQIGEQEIDNNVSDEFTIDINDVVTETVTLKSLGDNNLRLYVRFGEPVDINPVDYYVNFTVTIKPLFEDVEYISELKTFNISNCKSNTYENYRLRFINVQGGNEYFDFYLKSIDTRNIERKTFTQYLGKTKATGFNYQVGDRGLKQYASNINKEITVSSDWVTKQENKELYELFISGNVFHEQNVYYVNGVLEAQENNIQNIAVTNPHEFRVNDKIIILNEYDNRAYNMFKTVLSTTENSIQIFNDGFTFNLVTNPKFIYADGEWIVYNEDACGNSFLIPSAGADANKLVYSLVDGISFGCPKELFVQHENLSLVPGRSYEVSITVDDVVLADIADPQYVRVYLGGTVTDLFIGAGQFTETVICGPSGTLQIEAVVDGASGRIEISEISVTETTPLNPTDLNVTVYKYNNDILPINIIDDNFQLNDGTTPSQIQLKFQYSNKE